MTKKVSKDVAEQEFNRFCDTMRLEFDESDMDEEDLKSYQNIKNTILKSLEYGDLVINDEGEPVLTLRHVDKTLTFPQPTGSDLLALDKAKTNQDVRKMYNLLGSLVGEHPNVFATMPLPELKVCQGIVTLFFG